MNSAGPMSHQLKAFAKFLEEHSPLSQRNTLLNNVEFWLEVKKFSVSLMWFCDANLEHAYLSVFSIPVQINRQK